LEPQFQQLFPDRPNGPLRMGIDISKSIPTAILCDDEIPAIMLMWQKSSHPDAHKIVKLLQRKIDGESGNPMAHAIHKMVQDTYIN
jgi:hypothetical protein